METAATDTLHIYYQPGEPVEGQKMILYTSQLIHIRLEQRYQTSISIMDEGPHLDLTGWKHYTSPWKTMEKEKDGGYIFKEYTERDRTLFPEISIEELHTEVKKYADQYWYQLIRNIKSVTTYPASVGISRYFIRVTTRKDNGKKVTRLIIFENPMGC